MSDQTGGVGAVRLLPPARRLWVAPLVAFLLAATTLGFLMLPGSLLCEKAGMFCTQAFEPPPPPASPDPALQAQILQGLEQRIAFLRGKLAEPAVCSIDDYRVPQSADAAPSGRPLSKPALLSLADKTTFLIVSRQGTTGISTGTGFQISDRKLVTNRHVVENGDASDIVAYNPTAGRLRGRVLVASSGSQPGQDDFAVIELERPLGGTGLVLSTTARRGESVVAAGFPGLVLESDSAYRQLLEDGNSRVAIPPVPSTGIVMARQGEGATEMLVHSALIYPGNSGGPLLDECGRVVGVNTFIRHRTDVPSAAYFALGAQRLAAFLRAQNIGIQEATEACEAAGSPAPARR